MLGTCAHSVYDVPPHRFLGGLTTSLICENSDLGVWIACLSQSGAYSGGKRVLMDRISHLLCSWVDLF